VGLLDQGIYHVSLSLLGTFRQHHVACMTLNERGDLAVVGAEDQVAFPVTGHGPDPPPSGSLADRDGIADLALSCIPGMLVPQAAI